MAIHLPNITIYKRQTSKNETYFVIYDKDNNKSYFCFANKLKDGWTDLLDNYKNIQEVEIEFEEAEKGAKATSLFVVREADDIII